jgi:hypothetical protein
MTPEAIRTITDIRQEFYDQLASALDGPVHITKGSSYLGNIPKIAWTDSYEKANYACIYAHTAPDALVPDRPLILRLGINQGLGLDPAKGKKTSSRRGQKLLKFELTLLPNELLKFVPWVVNLLRTHEAGTDMELEPPCQLNSEALVDLVAHGAWTDKAAQKNRKNLMATAS